MDRLRLLLFLIIGLAIGIGLGLYLGWIVYPTEFVDANPAYLQENHKRDYALMIAASYSVDGDLNAARERLASLGADGQEVLMSVLLDMILQRQSEDDIRYLVHLANDLGLYSPAMDPYLSNTSEPTS